MNDQSGDLRESILDKARDLGFQIVGVTSPDPPPHMTLFENWLKEGRHGEMDYLASDRSISRRANPHLILPECRAVLVLGARYPSPDEIEITRSESTGRVASYAWGMDYHDVLIERMDTLVKYIEEQVGGSVPNRCYTDTGPVMERELGQRAGLGWIGKNTCLINPKAGSYFFMAEIFLGIDLEPDKPFTADYCGSCRRCIEACPTDCIMSDRTIDSRRCISYLTIELKGVIPQELRALMGDWIFGCDICQQVCPWNRRFAKPAGDSLFSPNPEVPRPRLVQELALTEEQFQNKFKGSPVKRAKRRGYLRNVAVALGNVGDPISVPTLKRALSQEIDPLVRAHTAWSLGKIAGKDALRHAQTMESDEMVLTEIRSSIQD